MQRVLAKVIGIKKISETNESNFRVVELNCKVQIKEPASKGVKLPPYMKGKIGWLISCVIAFHGATQAMIG